MNIHKHTSILVAAEKLCIEIADRLKAAIEEHGQAFMLVSGGSTPKLLFKNLSAYEIPWQDVVVGLVDERFVPETHEKSNAAMIKQELLANRANLATFLPMVFDTDSMDENLIHVRKAYKAFASRIDVVLLGMGKDGHTASLFPTDDASRWAIEDDCLEEIVNTTADVEPSIRISCSGSMLRRSEHLYLLLHGKEKLEVLHAAKKNNLPIAHFFETPTTLLEVHYTHES